ncbi:hypothetical protein N7507_007658 [Penicillium longicatenatum]|nr:hypothetical protein N7507_007658 [Penicillium longicatenatum]
MFRPVRASTWQLLHPIAHTSWLAVIWIQLLATCSAVDVTATVFGAGLKSPEKGSVSADQILAGYSDRRIGRKTRIEKLISH